MMDRVRLLAVALAFAACSQTGADPGDGVGTGSGGSIGHDAGFDAPPPPSDALVITPRPDGGAEICGNDVVDPGEQCDDGNQRSGDGCSPVCRVECSWVCGSCGELGACIPTACGDGQRAGAEQCDDANVVDGDGCSHSCEIEGGWYCPGDDRRCVPVCGDRKVTGAETCDDGNLIDGDGCSSACLTEPTDARCGDGMIQGAEACDPPTGIAFTQFGCDAHCRYAQYCGNAAVDPGEECDLGVDHNTGAYGHEGCMPNCRRSHYCGDGILDPQEDCDFGADNGKPSRTCTDDCHVLLPVE